MDVLRSTDSYSSLVFALPGLDGFTILSAFFLTLARIVPLLALCPFLGGPKTLPAPLRMMFGLALVAIFFPYNIAQLKGSLGFDSRFLWLCLKELLIGSVLGFLSSVPFLIAQMAGSLIDHQRGSSSLQVTDPTTQTQTSPIGSLYNYMLLALFFSLNGPFIFLDGVATSYQIIPIDQMIHPQFVSGGVGFWQDILKMLQIMTNLMVQISAPAIIGILLTDLFLGIANRMAPQVQIVFLGISLKSWVGIALMTAAWGLIVQTLGKESISWMKTIQHWIQQTAFYVK